jgi:hypothetical protein
MCLAKTTTPAPKNEDLNRIPSFPLIFLCLHACVYVMCCACACIVCCVCMRGAGAVCVRAWCGCCVCVCSVMCMYRRGVCCVVYVCVVCGVRVHGVCCVLSVCGCGVLCAAFFSFQQTTNDFDQHTSQRLQVTDN